MNDKNTPSRVAEVRHQGSVYFIQAIGHSGPIKVGYTKACPHKRLAALQIGSPVLLMLLCSGPGTLADEKRIHRQLSEHRRHGEWFDPAPAVLQVVHDFCEFDDGYFAGQSDRRFDDALSGAAPIWRVSPAA